MAARSLNGLEGIHVLLIPYHQIQKLDDYAEVSYLNSTPSAPIRYQLL